MKKGAKTRKLKNFIIPISLKDRLVVKIWIVKGQVIKFSVTYLRKIKQGWLAIKRCDNSHFYQDEGYIEPHCHIMAYKERELYKQPLKGEPKDLLNAIIKDFKTRRKILLENYFNNNYERKT